MSKRQLAINILKKGYEKKAEKQRREAERLNLKAENLKEEKNYFIRRKNSVVQEIEAIENNLTAIDNSSKYLVSCRGKYGSLAIEKFLNFLIYRNNQKILSLKERRNEQDVKIARIDRQIAYIDNEIYLMLEAVSVHLGKSDKLKKKLGSVDELKSNGISSAIFAHLILKEDTEDENLEKYFYKEISASKLKLIESLDYTERPSDRPDMVIIRYEKKLWNDFEKALSGAAAV